jgi:hypothetical protein
LTQVKTDEALARARRPLTLVLIDLVPNLSEQASMAAILLGFHAIQSEGSKERDGLRIVRMVMERAALAFLPMKLFHVANATT